MASTLEITSLSNQLVDTDADRALERCWDYLGAVLPKRLRERAHPHPDDEACIFFLDDAIWQMLEQPGFQSPRSLQETATILAQLATELINNPHSSRPFQAVTHAFSR